MILITDIDKTRRETVAEMFYYMGIPAGTADPDEVLATIGEEYSALLFTSPSLTPDEEYICTRVRELEMTTIVAISEQDNDIFDLVFPLGARSSDIAAAVSEHRRTRGLCPLGHYECMGINASCDGGTPSYLGEPLPLTRTEAMILRYLIKTYPRPVSPHDILRVAFRPSRAPEPSSVRTHISIMNKKLRNILGRALTEPGGRGGYVLAVDMTPLTV